MRHGVGALQRGDDPFQAAEQPDALQRLCVGGVGVFRAPQVAQPGVFRPDAGVVQAGADAVGERNLAVGVLEDIALGALEDAQAAQFRVGEARGMFAAGDAAPARLDADQAHIFVGQERMKDADRVAPAAHAGHHHIRQPPRPGGWIHHLLQAFPPDDTLEIAHHGWVGMGTQCAAKQVMGRAHVGDPVADGVVDGVFQGLAARFHAAHLRPQEAHAVDIGLLARHVDGAHVDHAFDAEFGGHGGGGHAMLAGAGLRHDARLLHLVLHEQRLSQRIVDLVRAGVGQILALDVDARAAEVLGQALGVGNGGRAADEGAQQVLQFSLKFFVVLGLEVGLFQLIQGRHKRFRHKLAAVGAEMARLIGVGGVVDRDAGRTCGSHNSFSTSETGFGMAAIILDLPRRTHS